MSARRFIQIACDVGLCLARYPDKPLAGPLRPAFVPPVAAVRKEAARLGWAAVYRRATARGGAHHLDICPAHAETFHED